MSSAADVKKSVMFPPSIAEAVKEKARQNRRSFSSEVVRIVEEALLAVGNDK